MSFQRPTNRFSRRRFSRHGTNKANEDASACVPPVGMSSVLADALDVFMLRRAYFPLNLGYDAFIVPLDPRRSARAQQFFSDFVPAEFKAKVEAAYDSQPPLYTVGAGGEIEISEFAVSTLDSFRQAFADDGDEDTFPDYAYDAFLRILVANLQELLELSDACTAELLTYFRINSLVSKFPDAVLVSRVVVKQESNLNTPSLLAAPRKVYSMTAVSDALSNRTIENRMFDLLPGLNNLGYKAILDREFKASSRQLIDDDYGKLGMWDGIVPLKTIFGDLKTLAAFLIAFFENIDVIGDNALRKTEYVFTTTLTATEPSTGVRGTVTRENTNF
jgi:hypothetical protein